jgi:hypothetical protein
MKKRPPPSFEAGAHASTVATIIDDHLDSIELKALRKHLAKLSMGPALPLAARLQPAQIAQRRNQIEETAIDLIALGRHLKALETERASLAQIRSTLLAMQKITTSEDSLRAWEDCDELTRGLLTLPLQTVPGQSAAERLKSPATAALAKIVRMPGGRPEKGYLIALSDAIRRSWQMSTGITKPAIWVRNERVSNLVKFATAIVEAVERKESALDPNDLAKLLRGQKKTYRKRILSTG